MEAISNTDDIFHAKAERRPFKERDFDLRAVLAEIEVQLGIMITVKGLYLDLYFTPDTPHFIQGDPQQLKKLINNLVCFSLKSIKVGGISLRISSLGQDAEGRERLLIEVTDTGQGILPEHLSTIFHPPKQTGELHQENAPGPSLLLAKRLARHMDGDVSVQSFFGWGSRYTASIALTKASRTVERNRLF